MKYNLCLDNLICCDDNCQRCAQLIYQKYREQKEELDKLKNKNNSTFVYCVECSSFGECENKESRDGCIFGEKESSI